MISIYTALEIRVLLNLVCAVIRYLSYIPLLFYLRIRKIKLSNNKIKLSKPNDKYLKWTWSICLINAVISVIIKIILDALFERKQRLFAIGTEGRNIEFI